MKIRPKFRDLGQRLKLAREATGWSVRKVIGKLPERIKVSQATLSQYEAGNYQPPLDLLSFLSGLYQRELNWFLGKGPVLSGVRYRNLKSKVGVKDKARFEATSQFWLEAYQNFERLVDSPLPSFSIDRSKYENLSGAEAGEKFRVEELGLNDDSPVSSVIEALEVSGVRVMELKTDVAIDAMVAKFGDECAIVTNPNVSNDRSRFNAAHELGHVVFGDYERDHFRESDEEEERANNFASSLLITTKIVKEAFKTKSIVRLIRYKERFGVSLAALVYRAQQENILPEHVAKRMWIEFAKRGWRKNEPGNAPEDRATRFEQLLEHEILEKNLTWGQVSKATGIRQDELQKRVSMARSMYQSPEEEPEGGSKTYKLNQM